ncbi:hypothetical protein GJ496_011562 [Pomphorhynchus laevis]|nr:hypothetical protein GJ496_011562 [Pomphorhynchus laevis]
MLRLHGYCRKYYRFEVVAATQLFHPLAYIFQYEWRHPCTVKEPNQIVSCDYEVEQQVLVKLGNARCTSLFVQGTVTRIVLENAVEVYDIVRHVLHLLPASNTGVYPTDETKEDNTRENKILSWNLNLKMMMNKLRKPPVMINRIQLTAGLQGLEEGSHTWLIIVATNAEIKMRCNVKF